MSESTIWWLLTAALIATELLTGTFYLLMLAMGTTAGAVVAHLSGGPSFQLVAMACVGGFSVCTWYWRQKARFAAAAVPASPEVFLDMGATVQVDAWNADGSAEVQYRGARWTAVHDAKMEPSAGMHRIVKITGNRLLLEKI